MRIRTIFENRLYALIWEDSRVDAFSDAFTSWTDVFWLKEHFDVNRGIFEKYPMTDLQAITYTRNEAIRFYQHIKRNRINLDAIFKSLDERSLGAGLNEPHKAKRQWLRIYALRIDEDMYLVTGSAIKHTERMDDHPLTRFEKQRLGRCKNFLAEQGVVCKEGFIEIDDIE